MLAARRAVCHCGGMRKSAVVPWFTAAACAAFSGIAAQGQAAQPAVTEQSVRAWLTSGSLLMLRGTYNGDKLEFDAHGNLRNLPGVMPFSLSAVQVDSVTVGGRVVIDATREGLEFTLPDMPGGRMQVSAVPWSRNARVQIGIKFNRRHPGELFTTLGRIFATGLDDGLADAAPDYWQPWLRHYLHPQVEADRLRTIAAGDAIPCRSQGITPPRELQPMIPDYSDAARRAQYGGVVVLHLTVDTMGRPEHIFIWRPLGMGLDDQAAEAVRQEMFTPAMQNGQPVACGLNMQVSFRVGGQL